MRDPDNTLDRLRTLLAYAERCGASTEWLRRTADCIVDLVCASDHRRLQTFDLARRVARVDAQIRATDGLDRVRVLMERFERGRTQVYSLLREERQQRAARGKLLFSESPDIDVMKSGS